MEPTTGVEPVTPSLPRKCSTTEPRGLKFNLQSPFVSINRKLRPSNHPGRSRQMIGAGDGTRTRDPQLGRLMLYQLSYSRPRLLHRQPRRRDGDGGEGRIRTSEGLRPADLQSAAFDRFATSPSVFPSQQNGQASLIRGRPPPPFGLRRTAVRGRGSTAFIIAGAGEGI